MIFLVVIHKAIEHFFSVISQRQEVTFQWDVDDVHFVLEKQDQLDFYSPSFTETSLCVDMSCHSHIILILSQPVIALTLQWSYGVNITFNNISVISWLGVLSWEVVNTNFIVSYLIETGLNPRSTTLMASMLTITPSMWLLSL